MHGILEERLKSLGCTVNWKEFPGGPQLLEGGKAGAVDFAHSGEAPPIFAQAAGAPLLYIGYAPDGPKSEAILVSNDSPVKTVADLKGKKIVHPMSNEVIAEQQRIADTFKDIGLIPATIKVFDAVRE